MRFTCATRSERGFSLLEILVAVCIAGILLSMAVVQIGAIRPGMQADGAMRAVMSQLSAARELAVAQRRTIEVSFIGTNRLQVIRHNQPTGTTLLSEAIFEGNVGYGKYPGVAADTPDGFGNGTAISFGTAGTVSFNSEGMLVDSGGTPVNGSVFLTIPNVPGSYRAVTVQGTTGRVRGFRWDGGKWTRV